MRLLALLTLVLAAACSGNIDEPPAGTADARPIGFREPPEPKEGSGTSPGCEGVTARGECDGGEAVYCDLDRGRLRRVDCEAMGQNCVVDISRGAICTSVGEDPTGGAISACVDTGISEKGFCAPDGTAIYCDTTGSEPVTRTWNCESAGKTCGVDDCAEGAFCCGGDDVGGGTGGEDNCGELDFNGICDGEVARWCGAGEPRELDCSATGQRCEVDTCATGAFCCGDVESTGGGEADECAQIGFEGVCTPEGTVRWCSDGQIEEVTCAGERTCQEDVCITGAACCLPAKEPPPENECTQIGWDGVCKDDTTVRFCAGEDDSDILEFTCSGEQTCQVDVCGEGANCCDPPATCESVNNAVGICEGDVLKYCTGGEIQEQDCAAEGKACEVDTCFSGFANCC